MIDPHVRVATDEDLGALTNVIRRAYSRYVSRMERAPAPMLRDYRDAIREGQVWVYGAPILGVISLIVGDTTLLIENVAVDPESQGAGVGRRLMEFAEARARELGLSGLCLYTNEVMHEDLAIYEHMGYVEVEGRVADGYNRVFMEKKLGAGQV
jgi:GNAT superfamily N-acetyltransferase